MPSRKCLIFTMLLKASVVFACPDEASSAVPDSGSALTIAATSMDVDQQSGSRNIATLGTINNSADVCFDSVVVEVNYYDSNNKLIDTIVQSLYSTVVPAQQSVSFRVLDAAAKSKESYATQSVRIVNAEPHFGRPKDKGVYGLLKDFLFSWGPLLFFILVWIYFMAKMRGKNSPQQRSLALIEQQTSSIDHQTKVLERIALALENGNRITKIDD